MRNNYVRKAIFLIVLALFCSNIIGCGETVSGAGKDIKRVGKGIKTIFVRDGLEE